MVYAAQQWTCDALLPVLPGIAAPKVLVPCGFSGLHWPAYRDYYRQMPEFLRRFDTLVVLSDRYRDTAFAREHSVAPLVLIPNGADEREFTPQPATPGFRERFDIRTRAMILTVGSHTGWKGHELAIEGFRRARIRDATLVVIGNRVAGGCTRNCSLRALGVRLSPGARRDGKHVRLIEADRPDTVAAYQAADLVLFPSRIECSPLVLFEAMAAGKPFAATPAGNAGEIIEWSGGGILIPGSQAADGSTTTTPDAVARGLETLMNDPDLRAQLGRKGHEAWRARFTFDRIAGEYEALYQQLRSTRLTRPVPDRRARA
jgi:glycosyltransferase involved in cell wall biosynthesis